MSCFSEAWRQYQRVNKKFSLKADAAEKVFNKWKFNPRRCLDWIEEVFASAALERDEVDLNEVYRMRRLLAEYGCSLHGLATLVQQTPPQLVCGLLITTELHEVIQEWIWIACMPGGEALSGVLILK